MNRSRTDRGSRAMAQKRRRHRSTAIHGNMFGYRGIWWDGERKKFVACIWPDAGVRGRYLGRHDTAEAAALAYDQAAREVYGRDAYLNFPNAGENKAEPSRLSEGLCAKGHNIKETGYVRPDGRGVTCRKCNNESSKRRYQRRLDDLLPDTGSMT